MNELSSAHVKCAAGKTEEKRRKIMTAWIQTRLAIGDVTFWLNSKFECKTSFVLFATEIWRGKRTTKTTPTSKFLPFRPTMLPTSTDPMNQPWQSLSRNNSFLKLLPYVSQNSCPWKMTFLEFRCLSRGGVLIRIKTMTSFLINMPILKESVSIRRYGVKCTCCIFTCLVPSSELFM